MSQEKTYTIKSIALDGELINISFEESGAGLSIPKSDAGNLKEGDIVTVNFGEKKVTPANAGSSAKPRRKE